MLNRIAPAVALAAAALFVFAAAPRPGLAQQMEETSMAMPALTVAFAPTYVSEAMGFWTKRGLNVKLHDIVGIGSMNAMLAGSVDFTNSSGPTIIRAYIRGQKMLGIGSTGTNLPFDIVVRKEVADAAGVTDKSPIEKRAAALKGKKVSVTSPNTIPHAYLRYFARKGGINPERDFTLATMPSQAGLAALKNGQIDAYVQSTPWGLIAVKQGGVLLDSAINGSLPELLPLAFNIVATRADFCDQKPSVCQKLMDGYLDGMLYMHSHPKESFAIIVKKLSQQDPEILKQSFDYMLQGTPKTTKVSPQELANAQTLTVEGGMIKEEDKLAKFDVLFTNKYAK